MQTRISKAVSATSEVFVRTFGTASNLIGRDDLILLSPRRIDFVSAAICRTSSAVDVTMTADRVFESSVGTSLMATSMAVMIAPLALVKPEISQSSVGRFITPFWTNLVDRK